MSKTCPASKRLGNNLALGDENTLEPWCILGDHNTVGSWNRFKTYTVAGCHNTFKSHNIFWHYAGFGNHCTFEHLNTWRDYASFGNHCTFGHYSTFGGHLRLGDDCTMGFGSTFGSHLSVGKRFTYDGVKVHALMCLSNLDGSGRQVQILVHAGGVHVLAGCFRGSLGDFCEKARAEGKTRYASVVFAAAKALQTDTIERGDTGGW